MNQAQARPWLLVAALVGVVYAFVGTVFVIPTTHVQEWRLAAWMVSATAFAAHILYECVGRRHAAALSARHVALAVAFGAFALAVRANIHAFSVASADAHRTSLLLSLGLWPLLLGLPAFLAAYCVSVALVRVVGSRTHM